MAATIANSVIASQSPQADGRIWVHERHTDTLGIIYDIFYLAADATGLAAHLSASAAQVLANAVASEIANNISSVETIGKFAVPTFAYSTVAQNVAALRIAYAAATQTQAIFIGDYLESLTDVQLENAFGWTAGQVATLRTNYLIPAQTSATSIRAAVGA